MRTPRNQQVIYYRANDSYGWNLLAPDHRSPATWIYTFNGSYSHQTKILQIIWNLLLFCGRRRRRHRRRRWWRPSVDCAHTAYFGVRLHSPSATWFSFFCTKINCRRSQPFICLSNATRQINAKLINCHPFDSACTMPPITVALDYCEIIDAFHLASICRILFACRSSHTHTARCCQLFLLDWISWMLWRRHRCRARYFHAPAPRWNNKKEKKNRILSNKITVVRARAHATLWPSPSMSANDDKNSILSY